MSASRRISWRDPAGELYDANGRLLRRVRSEAVPTIQAALVSPALREFSKKGNLISANVCSELERVHFLHHLPGPDAKPDPNGLLLEHPRVFLASYPYEWAPEMLYEAAKLHLDLAQALIGEGMGLKDGTAYNVLFEGPRPVFVDWLSFERRSASDFRWLPTGQFSKHFLIPLLFNRRRQMPLSFIFSNRRDGFDPLEAYLLCSLRQRWSPGFFGLVTLPRYFALRSGGSSRLYLTPPNMDGEKAKFILERNFASLRRQLETNRPRNRRSSLWSSYMAGAEFTYSSPQLAFKENFVTEVLDATPAEHVLDVGCNTGHFSELAAKLGSKVVAIDLDETSVGQTWRRARASSLDILPLVVNIGRPTPGIGWKNGEYPSFLERARGKFDMVFMLALLHHLLIDERIPLPEICDLAAELTRDQLIVEYIGPEDRQLKSIARGRQFLETTPAYFEAAFAKHFTLVKRELVPDSHRIMYHFRKTT